MEMRTEALRALGKDGRTGLSVDVFRRLYGQFDGAVLALPCI